MPNAVILLRGKPNQVTGVPKRPSCVLYVMEKARVQINESAGSAVAEGLFAPDFLFSSVSGCDLVDRGEVFQQPAKDGQTVEIWGVVVATRGNRRYPAS